MWRGRNVLRRASVLAIALALSAGGCAESKEQVPHEQTHFDAEHEAGQRQVKIPAEVMSILGKDDFVRATLEGQHLSADKLPTSWFSASTIHMAGPKEMDLLLVGRQLLVGANVTTFWAFRPTAHGYQMILSVPAHDLVVRKKRSNGYHDIEILSATAVKVHTSIFRFDGRRYKIARDEWEPIR